MVLVFAFSGLRFAGLPSHKALIVGPAEQDAGGRVTGTYYLLRNTVVIPSAALGGYLWEFVTPEIAFTVAAAIGLLGTGYFLLFGEGVRGLRVAPTAISTFYDCRPINWGGNEGGGVFAEPGRR